MGRPKDPASSRFGAQSIERDDQLRQRPRGRRSAASGLSLEDRPPGTGFSTTVNNAIVFPLVLSLVHPTVQKSGFADGSSRLAGSWRGADFSTISLRLRSDNPGDVAALS